MPKPTVTVRELKNKDSGLDLSIPSQDETPGLLGATVHYHVVTVTCLPCYKAPSHKPGDTVQFMVSRQISDFEKLKGSIAVSFPGTILPQLPKRSVLVGTNSTARRQSLQDFVSAIASLPKLATCQPLLEFLGVSILKAGGTVSTDTAADSHDIFEENRVDQERSPKKKSIFDDDSDNEDDLFAPKGKPKWTVTDNDDDLDLFKPKKSEPGTDVRLRSGSAHLFTSEDYTLNDEELLHMTGGGEDVQLEQQEDNSELLNIEDDLDELLKFNKEDTTGKRTSDPSGDSTAEQKPALKPKPGVKPKPAVKPKPQPEGKPAIKPKPGAKPAKPGSKPEVSAKPGSKKDTASPTEKDLFSSKSNVSKKVDSGADDDLFSLPTDDTADAVDTSDIMKYIEQNSDRKEEDLDLFS